MSFCFFCSYSKSSSFLPGMNKKKYTEKEIIKSIYRRIVKYWIQFVVRRVINVIKQRCLVVSLYYYIRQLTTLNNDITCAPAAP